MQNIDTYSHIWLKFFGRMNRHISHEIKNALATVSETAGLLEDVTEMARENNSPEFERTEKLCQRISSQIQRANNVILRMNGLAHSVDDLTAPTDLNKLGQLMADMSQYLPFNRPVIFTPDATLAETETSPIALLTFQYYIFRALFSQLEPGQEIRFAISNAGGIQLCWETEVELGELSLSDEICEVMKAVGATPAFSPKTITITA